MSACPQEHRTRRRAPTLSGLWHHHVAKSEYAIESRPRAARSSSRTRRYGRNPHGHHCGHEIIWPTRDTRRTLLTHAMLEITIPKRGKTSETAHTLCLIHYSARHESPIHAVHVGRYTSANLSYMIFSGRQCPLQHTAMHVKGTLRTLR